MTPEKIIEAWKATRADETRPAEDKAILKKVYENNLKAVLLNNDTINFVVSEFNKYTGKRIGEKTLEKINRAIEEAKPSIYAVFNGNGIRIRINHEKTGYILDYDNNYVDIERIYNSDDYNYKYLFDGEAKFKGLEVDKISVWYTTKYINDPESYINELKTRFEAIQAAADAYNKTVDAFGVIAVNGLSEFNHVFPKYYII